MKFEGARKSFLDHLQIERGLSPNSISAYTRDLTTFGGYLAEKNLDFATLNSADVMEYEFALKE
jgi:integrase/recombinase XerD